MATKTTDDLLDALQNQQADEVGTSVVLRIGDVEYNLDGKIRDVVLGLLRVASPERVLDITDFPPEITTGQAADLLGVSRPTVVQMVDTGEIPATRIGTRRRLRTIDVLQYRHQRSSHTPRGIDEIVEVSEDLGLYG